MLFSGNVPGEQRGALVERFHRDPGCRLFLSTDAGGVGLNLQHAAAAVVVNMDQPWNPAVPEQRIGRVHRMGQRRGVQVVNFIGQGSIEEGMLSVLAFKKSLFAGVLDGGAGEVFLGGTRLSQFMRSVSDLTGAMGEPESAGGGTGPDSTFEVTGAAEAEATAPTEAPTEPPGTAATTQPDPWPALLQTAAVLLQGLAAGGAKPRIETDPETGQPSLRLPLPPPVVLHSLAKALEP